MKKTRINDAQLELELWSHWAMKFRPWGHSCCKFPGRVLCAKFANGWTKVWGFSNEGLCLLKSKVFCYQPMIDRDREEVLDLPLGTSGFADGTWDGLGMCNEWYEWVIVTRGYESSHLDPLSRDRCGRNHLSRSGPWFGSWHIYNWSWVENRWHSWCQNSEAFHCVQCTVQNG